jgi:small-conductance mechanosensitive channel
MNFPFDLAHFDRIVSQFREYFFLQILSWVMLMQLAVVGGAFLLAYRITLAMYAWCQRQQDQCLAQQKKCDDLAIIITFAKIIRPFLAFVFLAIAWRLAGQFNWPRDGLYTAGIIFLAITLVRFFTGQMKNRFWAKILMTWFWFLAVLFIFHIIDHFLNFLQNIAFNLGEVQLSLLTIARALVLALTLYWFSRKLLIFWHFWLNTKSDLTPAVQILLYKLGGIFLYAASIVAVLHFMGLDLTVFALFGGALGLGLGFGLQKVVSNLVSGFIILADKSIKPGDVIQLGNKYGSINFLGTRYTSVVTREGKEHLIPNENLISGEVINWSYSHNLVRLNLPVNVPNGVDLEKVRDLLLGTAARVKRVLKDPAPSCLIIGFGDNTVNLELRVWINDPQNGVSSVKSDLYWDIWKEFREHHIGFPIPKETSA